MAYRRLVARSAGQGLVAVAVAHPLTRGARADGRDTRPGLYVPKIPYPGWDSDWDGLHHEATARRSSGRAGTSSASSSKGLGSRNGPDAAAAAAAAPQGAASSSSASSAAAKTSDGSTGSSGGSSSSHHRRAPTRHILLIRHGQYDETFKDDDRRKLTPLGQRQARATGERLGDILAAGADTGVADAAWGESAAASDKVIRLRCSTMTRARETRDIIRPFLPAGVEVLDPDPNLAEGRPAQAIPGKPFDDDVVAKDGARIEKAFRSLFRRATVAAAGAENGNSQGDHEWDVVVCHGNVIRYFVMRALQLPPEAWLRLCTFNCSVTYVVIRPSGSVSLRAMGDIGHLPPTLVTFSAHQGFEW